MHGYSRCVNYYFINFFSHLCALQSLSSTLFNLSSLTYSQHCLTTTQSPPPQPIITHDIPITKSTKNKEKLNQKSIQTQNQTVNGKLINLEPKIKLSTKNPSTQTQTQIEAAITTAMDRLLLSLLMENLLLPLEKRETSAWKLRQRKRSKNVEVERRFDFVR